MVSGFFIVFILGVGWHCVIFSEGLLLMLSMHDNSIVIF